MTTEQILNRVKNGSLSVAEAERLLAEDRGYEEMHFARLDTDREMRTGFPEVVFCQGKEDGFLTAIFRRLIEKDGRAFGTRASQHQYEAVRDAVPGIRYDPVSRILSYGMKTTVVPGESARSGQAGTEAAAADSEAAAADANAASADSEAAAADACAAGGFIAVCTAGTADIPVAEEAVQTAEYFGRRVERVYDVGVSGIHRLLSKADVLRRADCVIAVAGMEGALPSVIGGLVRNPVIAVPTSVGYGANLHGVSALLTMLNSCANGIAVVNIDNGYGAGYLAAQIGRLAETGRPDAADVV